MIKTIHINTSGMQLIEITRDIQGVLDSQPATEGLMTLFIQHTSASLIVQENADPSVQHDIIHWMNRIVPEDDPSYTHTAEGPDDMPAHIKSMLTQTSLSIPFQQHRLMLGTWQGVYLFEHRRGSHCRRVIAQL